MEQLPKINWTTVVMQAIVQIIVLGSLLVGYIITNERWKGGVDANMISLISINRAQVDTNARLQSAIDKLSESINVLSSNQSKVIALLEYHIGDDARRFNAVGKK